MKRPNDVPLCAMCVGNVKSKEKEGKNVVNVENEMKFLNGFIYVCSKKIQINKLKLCADREYFNLFQKPANPPRFHFWRVCESNFK